MQQEAQIVAQLVAKAVYLVEAACESLEISARLEATKEPLNTRGLFSIHGEGILQGADAAIEQNQGPPTSLMCAVRREKLILGARLVRLVCGRVDPLLGRAHPQPQHA